MWYPGMGYGGMGSGMGMGGYGSWVVVGRGMASTGTVQASTRPVQANNGKYWPVQANAVKYWPNTGKYRLIQAKYR